jgi:hypothetical protein
MRKIQSSGDILPVPTRKNTFLVLVLGLGLRSEFGLGLGVRENRILNGNQLFGPHKDSKTCVCVYTLCSYRTAACRNSEELQYNCIKLI